MGAPHGIVRLSFRACPVHVRTARLVAVTVARRTGWAEEQVELVRQGVGEACALALRAADPRGILHVELDEAAAGLTARVWPVAAALAADPLPRAVLAGLTDESGIDMRNDVSTLRLFWRGSSVSQ